MIKRHYINWKNGKKLYPEPIITNIKLKEMNEIRKIGYEKYILHINLDISLDIDVHRFYCIFDDLYIEKIVDIFKNILPKDIIKMILKYNSGVCFCGKIIYDSYICNICYSTNKICAICRRWTLLPNDICYICSNADTEPYSF